MRDKIHGVIDIETGGTKIPSPLFRIGIAIVGVEGVPMPIKDIGVQPYTCLSSDCKMDAETLSWWIEQSDAARKARDLEPRFHVNQALIALNEFLTEHNVDYTWGNSPSFDQAHLLYFYDLHGIVPHKSLNYYNQMDLRTIRALYPPIKSRIKAHFSDRFPAHIAVNDAYAEAVGLVEYLNDIWRLYQ